MITFLRVGEIVVGVGRVAVIPLVTKSKAYDEIRFRLRPLILTRSASNSTQIVTLSAFRPLALTTALMELHWNPLRPLKKSWHTFAGFPFDEADADTDAVVDGNIGMEFDGELEGSGELEREIVADTEGMEERLGAADCDGLAVTDGGTSDSDGDTDVVGISEEEGELDCDGPVDDDCDGLDDIDAVTEGLLEIVGIIDVEGDIDWDGAELIDRDGIELTDGDDDKLKAGLVEDVGVGDTDGDGVCVWVRAQLGTSSVLKRMISL